MVKYTPKKKSDADDSKKEAEAKKISAMYAKRPSKPGIKKKGY